MTWEHHVIIAAFLFVLGASVGSFLNVCLYRIPLGLSVLRPASRCPTCGSGIAPRDNLPILGWALLRGRSRCCREPISMRYPLVEFAAGSLCALVYLMDQSCSTLDPIESGLIPWSLRALAESTLAVAVLGLAVARYDRSLRRRGERLA